MSASYTVFIGTRRLATGAIEDVALRARAAHEERPDERLAVFEDATGRPIDLDLRGEPTEVLARLATHPVLAASVASAPAPRRVGRPKLGVTSREVSLLPRHWSWLRAQSKSASATLRLLVEERMKQTEPDDRRRRARDSAYAVMSSLGGDLPGFEEASRALFAGDMEGWADRLAEWPEDVRGYLVQLADPAS